MHLSRLARIISKPFGNGLLIGLGGNGRHCLTKLATYVNQGQIFKIELSKAYSKNEWTEDLKGLYKTLGLDNKKISFMFTDSDIKELSFMEDINNILNTGEIPHLFTKEEEEDI
jgi:dynein heavy chain